jgi:hypothetical protein
MNFAEILAFAAATSAAAIICRAFVRLQPVYERLRAVPLALLVGLYAINGAQALFNPLFNWSIVALLFATAGELLIGRHFVAGLLCFPFATLFYALGFQCVAVALEPSQILLALVLWLCCAVWLSRLLWTQQQRNIVAPLNVHVAIDALLVVSAYAAERALRRELPWLFIASFHFLLGDAVLFFDEFVAAVPLAALVIPALSYGAHITAAVGVLSLPSQGDDR